MRGRSTRKLTYNAKMRVFRLTVTLAVHLPACIWLRASGLCFCLRATDCATDCGWADEMTVARDCDGDRGANCGNDCAPTVP